MRQRHRSLGPAVAGIVIVAGIVGFFRLRPDGESPRGPVHPAAPSSPPTQHRPELPDRTQLGGAVATERREAPIDTSPTLEVEPGGIRGHVLEAGSLAPVEGADVLVARVSRGFEGRLERIASSLDEAVRVRTDAVGVFEVEHPGRGRIGIVVRADGFVPHEFFVEHLDESMSLDIELERGTRLAGFVQDVEANGIEGASLHLVESAPMGAGRGRTYVATSGPDGHFETDWFRAGVWTLSVEAADYARGEVSGTSSPGVDSGYVFELETPSYIGGIVVGDDAYRLDDLKVVPKRIGKQGVDPSLEALCRPDGTFRFRPLTPSSWPDRRALEVVHVPSGWRERLVETVDAALGDEDLVMTLEEPSWLAFGVVDEDTGEALEGPTVVLEHWHQIYSRSRNRATGALVPGDAPGRFRLRVAATDQSLAVLIGAKGTESYYRKGLQVEAGEVCDLGWIRLRRHHSLGVRVTDSRTSRPVSDARVYAVRKDTIGEVKSDIVRRVRSGETHFMYADARTVQLTGESGKAQVWLKRGETYAIVVSHPDYCTSAPIEKVGQPGLGDLSVSLGPGGTVVVSVERDGEPVPNVLVAHRHTLTDDREEIVDGGDQQPFMSVTDVNGRCVFERLPLGEHAFRVEVNGRVGPWAHLDAAASETTGLTLQAPPQ